MSTTLVQCRALLTAAPCPPPPPSAQPPQPLPAAIPQFYFPRGGGPLSEAARRQAHDRVHAFFAIYPHGLGTEHLRLLLAQVFGLPASLAYPLFAKLAPDRPMPPSPGSAGGDAGPGGGGGGGGGPGGATLVPHAALLAWLDGTDFWGKDEAERAFDILRQVSSRPEEGQRSQRSTAKGALQGAGAQQRRPP